jgi:hypothetical protein
MAFQHQAHKTRISCGKISETYRENVEAYSKTVKDKVENVMVSRFAFTLILVIKPFP